MRPEWTEGWMSRAEFYEWLTSHGADPASARSVIAKANRGSRPQFGGQQVLYQYSWYRLDSLPDTC